MSDLNKNQKVRYGISLFLAITGIGPAVAGSSGEELYSKQCQSCHELSGEKPKTVKDIWARKGPDFSSAGIKYKRDWVVRWLQNPVRIRPAGQFYGNHIKRGEKHDVIDKKTLPDHPRLESPESIEVTDFLMTQKKDQSLVQPGAYKPGTIAVAMGDLLFDKFKGCLACHQIEPGYGGLSGPEMYTAADRLQEDYLVSFMSNPQAWNSKTIMPNKNLKEKDVQKLVHYFHALSKENNK